MEFLEDGMEDSELSKEWQTMPYEKKMYFYQYSTVNTSLEEEANRLLEEYEKKLVYEAPIPEQIADSDNDESSETVH